MGVSMRASGPLLACDCMCVCVCVCLCVCINDSLRLNHPAQAPNLVPWPSSRVHTHKHPAHAHTNTKSKPQTPTYTCAWLCGIRHPLIGLHGIGPPLGSTHWAAWHWAYFEIHSKSPSCTRPSHNDTAIHPKRAPPWLGSPQVHTHGGGEGVRRRLPSDALRVLGLEGPGTF